MGKDINFANTVDSNGDYVISSQDGMVYASGNKLLANMFEITFLTNKSDSVLISDGGNGFKIIGNNYNGGDLQSMAALVKITIDNTMKALLADQLESNSLNTEKIESAELTDIYNENDHVTIVIKITPIEFDKGTFNNLNVVIPL